MVYAISDDFIYFYFYFCFLSHLFILSNITSGKIIDFFLKCISILRSIRISDFSQIFMNSKYLSDFCFKETQVKIKFLGSDRLQKITCMYV